MDDLKISIGSFGGMQSGRYDGNGVQWTWTDTSGWFDGPPARSSFTSRPGHNGAFPAPVYNDPRVIAIGLNIAADNEAHKPALEAARGAAQAALCNGPDDLTIAGAGPTTQARVYRSGATTCDPVNYKGYQISFQVTAVDPIRYGAVVKRWGTYAAQSDNSGLDFSAGGLDFGNGGLDFGVSSPASSMYMVNSGTAPTAPVFRFDTAQSQPVLKNASNGGRIEFLDSVQPGQSLVVDCKNKTVLLNGVDRLVRMRSVDFDAFTVPAGGSLRVFFGSLDYPTKGAHVSASLQDGYW